MERLIAAMVKTFIFYHPLLAQRIRRAIFR